VAALEDALLNKDAPRLREAAHKLFGMVSAFSTAAGAVASEIEDHAALGELDESESLMPRLRTISQELRALSGSCQSRNCGVIQDTLTTNENDHPRLASHLARWALTAFVLTFLLARILVLLIMSRRVPDFFLHVRQTHVHHLNYGIFLLAAWGMAPFYFAHRPWRRRGRGHLRNRTGVDVRRVRDVAAPGRSYCNGPVSTRSLPWVHCWH